MWYPDVLNSDFSSRLTSSLILSVRVNVAYVRPVAVCVNPREPIERPTSFLSVCPEDFIFSVVRTP